MYPLIFTHGGLAVFGLIFHSHLYFLSLQVLKKINKHSPNRSVQSYLSFILGLTPQFVYYFWH